MKYYYKNRQEKGITLVALVITIILLLILAGVSIHLLLGDTGIISEAKLAKDKTEQAKLKEEANLNLLAKYIQNESNKINKELIHITINLRSSSPGNELDSSIVIEAEKGMTWEQWFNSEYRKESDKELKELGLLGGEYAQWYYSSSFDRGTFTIRWSDSEFIRPGMVGFAPSDVLVDGSVFDLSRETYE